MSRRVTAGITVGPLLVMALAVTAFVITRTDPPPSVAAARPATTTTTTAPPPPPPVPAETIIAEVTGPVPFSDRPGGDPVGSLPMGSWWKDTKHLPVIDEQAGWLQVRLPQRPNGLTGWIASSDATLSTTTYGILIDTGSYRVKLYESGELVADFPAGVGTPDDPTPLGDFYVMDVAEAPNAGWGPFIVDTNAHSETIDSWQGSGDAFTAIHGPLGLEHLIGEGSAISHGCVRMYYDDLAQLSPVPRGAPVVIV